MLCISMACCVGLWRVVYGVLCRPMVCCVWRVVYGVLSMACCVWRVVYGMFMVSCVMFVMCNVCVFGVWYVW